MTIRPRRSVLYMPGSNARAIDKARTLPVDGVILDLEDAVAPDAKADARARVADAVRAGGFGYREVVIRVNALDTPWFSDDFNAAVAARPDAILVPKISTPDQIEMIGQRLLDTHADHHIRLWAMIETPAAIFDIRALAAEAADSECRLAAFVIGTNDLAKETRARIVPGRAPMLSWLATCVLAAHSYGIDVLDGVYNDLSDANGFVAECAQGRDMGFDGKTLIHPNQIGPCNAAFSPSVEETAQARKIIAAFELPENQGKGVVQLDGRMVERMHADIAQRTVAIAEAIERAQAG
ncbi:MAG TPA: CoA ester lyase [Xanthobacteraceae bacterium]|jgi:citrate lyase subunit beta/citryl-CoA lyase